MRGYKSYLCSLQSVLVGYFIFNGENYRGKESDQTPAKCANPVQTSDHGIVIIKSKDTQPPDEWPILELFSYIRRTGL